MPDQPLAQMRSRPNTVATGARPLTFQVTLTVLALTLFTVLMVVGFGLFAVMRADGDALQRQKAFVTTGIQDAVNDVVQQQQSIAIWDDAVTFAKAHDQQWMIENLGKWMYDYYGHDRAYVLDEHNRSVHAMVDGKTVAADEFSKDEQAIAPLVAKLRQLLVEIAAWQGNNPPKPYIKDLVTIAGKPAIASVMAIVPSSGRVTQDPGSEYLHVAVQFIDDQVVGAIARQYLLSDARLMPLLSDSAASEPIIDSRGVILGYIGWSPDRPGLMLVEKIAPGLGLAGLLSAGVLWFLLRRLRRASNALQNSQNQAQFLAFHDTLTQLPNRALFEDRLRRAFVTARRDHARIALLYIDLDRFKNVNDTLGHPAGDELVRQTAQRLEACVREVDTVARLGGDEFAVIVMDIKNAHAAEMLSRRILDSLANPFVLMGDQVFIGASIGIALSLGSDQDPDDLLRKADIALYEAKRNGRGRSQVFAGDMDDLITRRRLIESDLRAALNSGDELRLAYQPIFAADCRTVLGAEALLRWQHPVHGALAPASFVAIAEERGMIDQLGKWVLSSALRFAVRTDLPWIAVNVSPLQLRDDGFAAELLAMLATIRLSPARLQLEITEGVLLDDNDVVKGALSRLRKAGVRIVLDDFGTGYSSIGYLRRHTVDKLKIDRSFMRQLGSGEDARAIVEAIVRLARALRMSVTAEGIETPEQRDLVVGMGCSELQGLLLSAPLTDIEMRALIMGGTTEQPRTAAM
jgi:diguanylate cyclase (GGDEF)-like protein